MGEGAPLEERLTALQTLLSEQIGPIASTILRQEMKKVSSRSNKITYTEMHLLAERLAPYIRDPRSQEAFRRAVRQLS